MPIYEYKCNTCKKDFETLVMGRTKPQCPGCDSQDLSRLMSTCGFVSKSATQGGAPQVKKSAGASGCGTCASSNCGSCGMG
ncbi:MAG: zinc ribbon domain-containing protein [Desulfobacteraceae bacterium]|nr:zinc ribbon domain-containing protein [Desulfobacteraceae bacterium]